MNEPASSSSRPIGRTIVAGLILILAGWVLLHFLIGIATAIAGIAVFVVAVIAVIWALRVIL